MTLQWVHCTTGMATCVERLQNTMNLLNSSKQPSKLAELILRQAVRVLTTISLYFLRARKVYESQIHFQPELARHYFIQSQALEARGEREAAITTLDKAHVLYKKVAPHAKPAPLTLELLNGIVAPWVW